MVSDMPHQREHADALCAGLARHGIATEQYPEHVLPPGEIVACWGWRIGEPLRAQGKRVLVMERGYIDRMRWCSLGWNGLNGRAERHWVTVKGRGSAFYSRVRPWKPEGRYVLIIGQVSGDAAVKHFVLSEWYAECVRECARFGLPIKFRPHPVAVSFGQTDRVAGAETIFGDLQQALSGAAAVVTLNSNTGVDALLAGKPTITRDAGSMAWPVAAHDWTIQPEPYRWAWIDALASAQFTLDELRSGLAWEIVKHSPAVQ